MLKDLLELVGKYVLFGISPIKAIFFMEIEPDM